MKKLAAYRAKRDFAKTPEPAGAGTDAEGFGFVIQKHDASRLHYDLRLELDGVMKSWAVTKGPSLVPTEKRLAVHVEDHPVEYNAFEGRIPKGQYGGGTVLLWDRGRWEPQYDPHKGYKKGHLEFRLEGEKLQGIWHLVRMRKKPGDRQEPWLLIKSEDEFARPESAPDILDEAPLSVASGRSLEDIAGDATSATWDSNRGTAAEARAAKSPTTRSVTAKSSATGARAGRGPAAKSARNDVAPDLARLTAGARKAAMPRAVEPCLATLVSAPPRGARWVHEIKWDGYRLVAFKTADKVRLATRRGLDWTARFPGIAEALAELPVETAILDGEAVILDQNGAASFAALQNALSNTTQGVARDAVLMAFDLLFLEGHDLRDLPLDARKERLATLIPSEGPLRFGEHLEVDGAAMLRSVRSLGLEGVVSKRRDRPYRSGRSPDWVKIKTSEQQEFVVAGYLPSNAGKRAVGSLVLAYYEDGALHYAGRAGSGYGADTARDLWRRLDPNARKTAPFTARLTAEERRGVVWVDPTLVATVEHRGWTPDGRLRHAAFKGLRDDKEVSDVVRERPADRPAPDTKPASAKAEASRAGRKGGPTEFAGVRLTHPERVLWEDVGLTKQGLAEYYLEIADWLLPHLANRPLSLVRCPSGVEGGCFFQKHAWAGLGETIHRKMVADEDGEEEVLWVEDIRGVLSLVQASVLEIHPWGAGIADPDRPDRITMDLDPGDGVAWSAVMAGARELRERLAAQGLESFVKTTGGKGLHVVVPLDGSADWTRVKAFAHDLADGMERDSPKLYVAKATKAARTGRTYVDYLRNGRGATAIAAYSSRARPGATVSVPLAWTELTAKLTPGSFDVASLPARLKRQRADPWAEIGRIGQALPGSGPKRRR